MAGLLKMGISHGEKMRNQTFLINNYDWDIIAKKTHQIYTSILENN